MKNRLALDRARRVKAGGVTEWSIALVLKAGEVRFKQLIINGFF
jgi:hypothetical protein